MEEFFSVGYRRFVVAAFLFLASPPAINGLCYLLSRGKGFSGLFLGMDGPAEHVLALALFFLGSFAPFILFMWHVKMETLTGFWLTAAAIILGTPYALFLTTLIFHVEWAP